MGKIQMIARMAQLDEETALRLAVIGVLTGKLGGRVLVSRPEVVRHRAVPVHFETPDDANVEIWVDQVMSKTPEAAAAGKRDPLACPCCVFGGDDCWCRADCGVERCQARDIDLDTAFASGMRVRTAPCTVDGHHGEHFQVRTNKHWLCGHLLASLLTAQGIAWERITPQAQPAPDPYRTALIAVRDVLLRDGDSIARVRSALAIIDSLDLGDS
jgi:hypothetical protein